MYLYPASESKTSGSRTENSGCQWLVAHGVMLYVTYCGCRKWIWVHFAVPWHSAICRCREDYI